MSRIQEQRRADHKAYKGAVGKRGKPFFPYAMFHDTVMSLLVVVTIIALAVIWHETIPGDNTDEENTQPGWIGPLYDEEADPGTTTFVPRPDWYFYFLFYLLRIFKWPDTVFLGTVGVPTIGLILLLGLPFYDRRRERRLSHRPVAIVAAVLVVLSMGTLTWKGATAEEGGEANFPVWVAEVKGLSAENEEGATIFAKVGCMSCHTYNGDGATQFGAPDLADQGTRMSSVEQLADYIANPADFGNTTMPPFAELGDENLQKLAAFLAASQGEK